MYSIRKANINDSVDIANIHYTSWGVAYADLLPAAYSSQNNNLAKKTDMWQKIIVHPDVSVWLAYDDNNQNSLGFIGYFNKGNNYEITTLYVLPDYQHLGVGSELMKIAFKEILASNPNAKLSLWVLETNIAAINFYKKQGFIVSGEKSEEVFKNLSFKDLFEDTKIVDIQMIKVS